MSGTLPSELLARIEDASINASAPTQQLWLDGWLVRFSPGKAKRARCVNAVGDGRLSLEARLEAAAAVYRGHGLPLYVRITPFSRPVGLDDSLEALGFTREDDTRVMVLTDLTAFAPREVGTGLTIKPMGPDDFAQVVGEFRQSPLAHRLAHADRLCHSPVPYFGYVVSDETGRAVACAQYALQGAIAGLYDVFTAEASRGRSLAKNLCASLLECARRAGAQTAYLQVEADNGPARAAYKRLGFKDAYAYHYRRAPGKAVTASAASRTDV